MKKRRIAASIMAAIMTLSTFSSSVLADDVVSVDENISSEEAVLSGSAVYETEETADVADNEDVLEEPAEIVAYADGFTSGGMGNIGKNFSAEETADGVNLKVTAANKGKVSDGADNYA